MRLRSAVAQAGSPAARGKRSVFLERIACEKFSSQVISLFRSTYTSSVPLVSV
ncbi:hypothetical protein [Oceanobacillus chungangensis]|uniref:hypothetical protein n=1 Tax=Oceanobacillus chungangensis TaxID=1229152 RepID=UPI0014727EA7|nr:hypothetical protein [Oceanobacillus chungangensis]